MSILFPLFSAQLLHPFWAVLKEQVEKAPFYLIATLIFFLALIQIFCASSFSSLSKHLEQNKPKKKKIIFFLHLLGEVEIIFALWVIPLMIVMFFYFDFKEIFNYLTSLQYTEVLFLVAIMIITASTPITTLATLSLQKCAHFLGGSLTIWWILLLTVGPLLGSFITEIGAITLCASLLKRFFYIFNPSIRLAYATLGLLFVNISLGGVMTTYAAPAVLIVAKRWQWDNLFMLRHFGYKALAAIILNTILGYFCFRKELALLSSKAFAKKKGSNLNKNTLPSFKTTTLYSCLFILTVVFNHSPLLLVCLILLMLGAKKIFYKREKWNLKNPIFVALFFIGLIIHGSFQGWWLDPLLQGINGYWMLALTLILTTFNDNAAITYMLTLVPHLEESVKVLAVSGAILGGGLTIIANVPNPAGYAILKDHFAPSISALKLFAAALIPTLVATALFLIL